MRVQYVSLPSLTCAFQELRLELPVGFWLAPALVPKSSKTLTHTGLRARMEAGFSRMNSLTVIQASQGLATYVLKNVPLAASKGIVVGRDARHNSEKFAKLAAAAFIAKGIKVWWYEDRVHTPLVPFGVFELGAAAGVMITASHVSYRISFDLQALCLQRDGIRTQQNTTVRATYVRGDHFADPSRL
jgi:hypothetical protein